MAVLLNANWLQVLIQRVEKLKSRIIPLLESYASQVQAFQASEQRHYDRQLLIDKQDQVLQEKELVNSLLREQLVSTKVELLEAMGRNDALGLFGEALQHGNLLLVH